MSESSPHHPIRLVIHGGAGAMSTKAFNDAQDEAYREALKKSLMAGYEILKEGGDAVHAVIAAINQMEDCPLFNAGKGAVFTNEGKNELDASIMDGKTLNAGAVAAVTNIKNPIDAAYIVMTKTPHVLMTSHAAEKFAAENGAEVVDPSYFFTEQRFKQLQLAKEKESFDINDDSGDRVSSNFGISLHDNIFGTVGAVALDQDGNLAAGTSTGGMTNKRYGRVGDSPIIGAGTYANNETVAVSCTGTGEKFIQTSAAHNIHNRYRFLKQDISTAAKEVLDEVKQLDGLGGIIAVDRDGNFVAAMNTKGMFRGTIGDDGIPLTAIYGSDEFA